MWICILALGRAAYGISGYEGPCVGKVEKGKAKGGHGASTGGLWGKAGGAYNTLTLVWPSLPGSLSDDSGLGDCMHAE